LGDREEGATTTAAFKVQEASATSAYEAKRAKHE